MSSFSWLKDKCEASSWKVTEVVQAYNDIANKYNDLQAASNLMKCENARLTKKLKEAKTTISVQEAKLKKVKLKAEYYEDKSHSIEMFLIEKVHAEIMKEFTERKSPFWDPEADFKSWEKIKTLYSESKEKEDELVMVAFTKSTEPSGEKSRASTSEAGAEEEVVVEDGVE